MTLKITGAKGFIGQAIIRYCRKKNIDYIGYTRRKNSSQGLTTVSDYSQIPEGGSLIHLAEESVAKKLTDEVRLKHYDTADVLSRKNFEKIVYASSASVYKSCTQPITTDCHHFDSTPYAISKRQVESLLIDNAGNSTIIARISNVYGPGMACNSVLSKILAQVHEDSIVVNALQPIRDFIWVSDVAELLVCSALCRKTGLFHFGTGIGTSIKELISHACEVYGNNLYEVLERDSCNQSMLVLEPSQTLRKILAINFVTIREGLGLLRDLALPSDS